MSSSPAPDRTPPPVPAPGEPGAVKHPAPPSPWAGEGQRSLLRPSTLVLLFLAMGFVLVMLFPGENYNDPRYTSRADGVSVAYLRAIVKVRPHDPEPRLVLARQLLSLALLDEALAVLQPLLPQARVTNLEAETLALDVQERRFYAVESGDVEKREDALDALIARMERLLEARVPAGVLERLARLSLSLDQPGRAARIYLRLARFERRKRGHYLDLAGRWFLAGGEHEFAARSYKEAAIARRDRPEQAASAALKAVDALLAADQPKAALQAAGGPAPGARRWSPAARAGAEAGAVGVGSRAGLHLRHVAGGELPRRPRHAAAAARAGSGTQPLGRGAAGRPGGGAAAARGPRRAAAAGPDRALGGQSVHLPRELGLAGPARGDAAAVDEAMHGGARAARLGRLVEMLTLKAEREGLSHEQLVELSQAYEALANPQAAVLAVQRWGNVDDRRTWELLAHLHDGAGRDAEELAVWQEIERRFGKRIADVMRQAELSYRLGRPDERVEAAARGPPPGRPERPRLLAQPGRPGLVPRRPGRGPGGLPHVVGLGQGRIPTRSGACCCCWDGPASATTCWRWPARPGARRPSPASCCWRCRPPPTPSSIPSWTR